MSTRFTLCLALITLVGCASQIPELIKLSPDPDPEYLQVKGNYDTFLGQYVRWGGKIISVENRKDSTWIEILASPLNSFGLPGSNSDYEGRFIARIDGFLDPELYGKDRYLTIFGSIDSELVQKIDEHPYSYPLVRVEEYYLWSEYRTAPDQYQHYYPYYHGYYYPYYRKHFRFYNYY